MEIPLTDFELETLNSVVHTHTFGEFHDLRVALRKHIEEQKEYLLSQGKTIEADFPAFESQCVTNILHFLEHNGFVGEREGDVHFLTHKGEDLRRQGTVQNYMAWLQDRETGILDDLHTIEKKGYLARDQVAIRHEVEELHKEMERKPYTNYMPYYVLIIVIIAILVWIGKSHLFR